LSKQHWFASAEDRLVTLFLRSNAALSILVTGAIVIVLTEGAIEFFREVTLWDFLTGMEWTPLFEPRKFGAVPIIWGSLLISFGASLVSIPLGLAVAIFLSEYATFRVRSIVKPLVEVLAGIPSVVFGYFALAVVTPMLRSSSLDVEVFNCLSAVIAVGIMTVPLVSSMSDDALQAVSDRLREAGYALGATKFEVTTRIVVPSAAPGVIASFILAFSRAIGETMAVTLAAGSTPNLTLNLLESIQTMTAYIVQVSLGDVAHGSIEYKSLFAVAAILFLITLSVNVAAQIIVNRTKAESAI
jgi:phosphate transport system permease protein